MATPEATLKVMAGAIMKLQSQVQAQDLLLKALYAERATQREVFPKEAEDEIGGLVDAVERAARDGYEGEERHLAEVQAALRTFGETLRERLEEQRL
ncbi:hypothetical protein [Aureimonas pseudogalii]|uniref:Uncharacterized protein n=1 Tax=Aureimonas pseudogalii TaxID=1744844 RepID=A0A7W6EBR4_9HYPH|nr:hypothetical protein [Aureimonas pseudogalii]MBB3997106.1 hypothetical protein [Aureimonas pseudogalii]